MNQLRYTLPCPDDDIELEDKIKILYKERKGWELYDVLINYPKPTRETTWLIWKPKANPDA